MKFILLFVFLLSCNLLFCQTSKKKETKLINIYNEIRDFRLKVDSNLIKGSESVKIQRKVRFKTFFWNSKTFRKSDYYVIFHLLQYERNLLLYQKERDFISNEIDTAGIFTSLNTALKTANNCLNSFKSIRNEKLKKELFNIAQINEQYIQSLINLIIDKFN